MRSRLSISALTAAALVASATLAGAAPERLVSPLAPTQPGQGDHTLTFEAPASSGRWFLTVTPADQASAHRGKGKHKGRGKHKGQSNRTQIRLNGSTVFRWERGGSTSAERFVVPVAAGTNTLQVRNWQHGWTLRVDGVVPEASLSAPFPGQRVAVVDLLDETLRISGWHWWRIRRASASYPIAVPATEALLTLRAETGPRRVLLGRIDWQGQPVDRAWPGQPWAPERLTPLEPATAGSLDVKIWGRRRSQARFRVEGILVDPTAPTVSFTDPPSGSSPAPTDPVSLAFADVGSGIDLATLRILLNGHDVTSAFQVSETGASAALADLPAAAQGSNTLEARIADLACNEASAVMTFVLGQGDTTPPTLTQPPDLVQEQATPAGTVVTYTAPLATDDLDPAPNVVCLPASGSVFPAGATTVTCTASDAAGNQSTVSFTVTVQDTTPPTLAQPPDRVVEQASPFGAIVDYTAPGVSDAADPAPVVSSSIPSGSTFAPGTTSVTWSATDSSGNTSAVSFNVQVEDTTPPALTLSPADGVTLDTAAIAAIASFSDVAGVTSFTASLNGQDVSASFTLSATSASWAPPPLEDGPHVFSVSVTDAAGNTSTSESTFTVRAAPVRLELTVAPGSPTDLRVLSVNDLQVRAVSAQGTTATSFIGFVLLTTSDTREPVHGLVLDFSPAEQGVLILTDLLIPQAVGLLEITARSLQLEGSTPATTLESGTLTLAPRSIDGLGNNLDHPAWGSTGEALLRLAPSNYSDGVAAPAGAGLPSARAISNSVHTQQRSIPNLRGGTDLVWVWGQFVDHDIDLTPGGSELFPIPVPPGDPAFDPQGTGGASIPFERSAPLSGTSPREHPNQITAWLDGSVIYGSDATRQAALRANDGTGRLAVEASATGDLLPRNLSGLDNAPTSNDPSLFLAGDVRANENILLSSMHTLWVREHNRLADSLRAQNPALTGNEIYQRVRRRVIAQVQAITYREWLPVLLGPGSMPAYPGYDAALEVGIFTEFSTASYRMGHSMLSSKLLRLDPSLASVPEGPLVELRHAFFNPDRIRSEGGIDPLLRGAALKVCQRLDVSVIDEVRSFLFGPPGSGGLDLAALNIQRGRDHGLPTYNELRRQLGLASKTSFAEISSDPTTQAALAASYANVEEIELWTGSLAEDRLPGAMVGELVFTVLRRQFELLRDGDRYWYQRILSPAELAEVEGTRLCDVIRRNTQIGTEIPDAVFAPFEASIQGQITLTVTIDRPLIAPPLPSAVGGDGDLALSGFSFPGQTVELLSNGSAIATTQANGEGAYSFSVTLVSGTYTLQTRATDPSTGDVEVSDSGVVVVTVVDSVPPVLTPSPDLVITTADPLGATVTFATPTATDAIDPNPTVACFPASGTLFPLGTTLVTCLATDSSGNSASQTFTVTVQLQPTSLSLELVPAAGSVVAGTSRDLRLRVLGAQGQVATHFTGTVLLTTSDGLAPLDGTLVSFTSADQGEQLLAGLALFRTAGPFQLNAETLTPPLLQGSLSLSVLPAAPSLLTAISGAGDRTLTTGEAPPVVVARVEDAYQNPIPGVSVRLVVGAEQTLDASTDASGQVTFAPSAISTPGVRACILSTPNLSLAPTTFVWTVNAGVPPPGPSVLTVTSGGSDATIDEGERAPTLVLQVNSGSAAGAPKPGQVVTWTIRDDQGALLAERRGISVADGSVSILGPRLSAVGVHDSTITVSNPQGAPLTFQVTVLAKQHVSGLVLDASRDPGPALEGVTVRVRGTPLTTTTERDGSFRFEAVPAGHQVLEFDGRALGTFSHVSQALVVSGTTALARPLFLPRFEDPGVPVPLNAQDETTQAVAVPLLSQPLARLTVAAGARVLFPSGAAAEITATQVELDELVWPLPSRPTPATAVLFGPAETQFPDGATLELPNDLGLPAGTSLEVYSADLATGAFALVGAATVTPDATRAVTTGPVITHFSCFVAVPAASSAPSTTLTGRVLDDDGTPLVGAIVSYLGETTTTVADDPATTGIDEAGTFTIPGVSGEGPPATAVATRINGNGYPESGRSLTATRVPGGQTDVGTFKISAKTAISGRLVFDNGSSVVPTGGGRASVLARVAATAGDGTFVVPDVPSNAGPVKVFGYELTHPTLTKGFVVASGLIPHGQIDVGDVLLEPRLSSFTTLQEPALALGTTSTPTRPLGRPEGSVAGLQATHTCADCGRVFVALGQEILIWHTAPTTQNQPPDVVLGTPGSLTPGLPRSPTAVFSDHDRLYVGDLGRVLVYENPENLETGDLADFALGQADLAGTLANRGTGQAGAETIGFVGGVFSNGELLYVLDRGNNRLLGWRTPPQSMGQVADFVIGQPTFTSTTSDFEGVTARTLCASPRGLSGDSNRLYVADTSNHRVLVFSPLPDQTLASASLVLGQTTFSGDLPGQLNMPTAIASDGQELLVSGSNGVMAWAQPPTQTGEAPQQLTTTGEVVAIALSAGKLYAAKTLRGVEIFSSSAAFAAGETAEVALLSAGPNVTGLDAGRSAVTPGHTTPLPGGGLLHQNLGALGSSRWDTVLHNNQPADSITGTSGLRITFATGGARLYSVDIRDPRIEARALGGLDLDSPPLFVLPAPNTSTLAANGDSLFLGERFSPFLRRFSPLPSGPVAPVTLDLDLGGAAPVSVRALAAGSGFVAVQGQGRILLFQESNLGPSPAGTTPSLVLGQGSISENVFYPTDTQDLVHIGLGFEQEVATDGTRVYARGANQQILVWETLPTTPGEPADAILAGRVVRVSADSEGVFAGLATGGIGKWVPGAPAVTPAVSSLETPVSPQTTGVIPIAFTLKDLQSDATDVSLAYSIDDGQTFSPLTLAGGATNGLATSPQGVSHSALWDSRADIPQRAGLVRIRVLPQDASGSGIGNHTYRFTVDNAPLSVAEVITEVRELARGVRRVEVAVDVTNRGLGPSVLNPASLSFSDDQGADLSGFFTVQPEGQVPALIQPGGIARFRFRVDVSESAPLGSVEIGASVTGTEFSTGAPLGPELARVPGLWELVESTTTATFLEGPALEAFVGQDGPRTYTLQLTPTTDLVNLRIVSGAAFSAGTPFLNVSHGSSVQLRGVVPGGTTLYVNRGATTIAAFPLEVRPPANYLVSPAAVDFGAAAIGTPLTRTITVDALSGTLNIDQIQLQPAGAFSLVGVPGLPAAVASGSSTSFTLRYDPQVGLSTADLVITTQDAQDPITRVRLEGLGTGDDPGLLFAQPGEGACSDGTGQLTLTYADPDGVATGTLVVTLNGVDVTSSFTAGASQATASLAALSPPEGVNSLVASIQDSLGNQGTTSRTFVVDQTAPLLSLSPSEGATVSTTQVPISLTWSDAGCGVDPGSLSVLVDGLDRSGAFTTTATGAQATLTLAEGAHTLTVSIADQIGLPASVSSSFTVALSASSLSLRLVGADPAATPALTAYDLRVEALTSAGNVDPAFSGEVEITTTPVVTGLNSLRGTLSAGVLTLPGAARFSELGGVSLSVATTSAPALQGSLGLNVVVDRPGFVTLTRVMDGLGKVSLSGLSFPGLAVGIYADDVLVQTEIANGTTGAFGATFLLGPTVAHDLQLRAIEPGSQAERQSDVETVVPAPASLSLTLTPEAQDLGLGELSQLQLTRVLSDGTSQDVTGQAVYTAFPGGVVTIDAGLLTAVGTGSTTVAANLNGELATATVNVGPPVMTSTSPAQGEAGVAVTRETILRFSVPISTASVTSGAVVATFAGQELPGRLHLSADRRSLTLFYGRPLPPSSRIRVVVNGDLIETPGGIKLDADRDGTPGGFARIDFETLTLTASAGTAVCGRIFASELNGQINVPLRGVHISVDGVADVISAITDANGDFRIDPAPDGAFFVHIDGATATNADIPAGNYYPTVGKVFVGETGLESKVGNVFLPLVVDGTLTALNTTGDTMITLPPSVEAANPDFVGTQLIVPEGALFNDDGSGGGSVGIALVPPDRLPGVLPPGLTPSFVITVQTDGASNFDQPVGVRFPNTDELPAGTELGLWSFNHDTGQWETSGTMHVTADGLWVETDPGVGVRAPGWHTAVRGTSTEPSDVLDPEAGGSSPAPVTTRVVPGGQGGEPGAEEGKPEGGKGASEPKKGDRDADSVCKTGCSVILSTGEERFSRTDLVIPGRGQIHFSLTRTYRSRVNYDGPLGHGWTWNFNESLFVRENGDVLRQSENGSLKVWKRLPDGSYQQPPGLFRTLVRRTDGSFASLSPSGFKRFYRSDGKLFCWEDRFGNRMLFDYDGRGNLSTVVDVYGREIALEYEAKAGRDRLVVVRDFSGREVRYGYDESTGDLIEVRTPVVTGTSTGNDFPNGRRERYEYLSGYTGAEADLNHNLTRVIAPQEVAEGRNEAWLTLEYDAQPSSPFFDRCTAETIGGTRDIDGLPVTAGGRRAIVYDMLSAQDLIDLNLPHTPGDVLTVPVGRATITEANGLVRQYHVNAQQDHIVTRILTETGKSNPPLRPGEPDHYETQSCFTADHRLVKRVFPEGNELHLLYPNSPHRARTNVLEVRRKAGPRLGGEDIVVSYTYEPLFNQVHTVTDPRGNATNFSPPLGAPSAERYTTRTFFDYQEHTDPIPLALEFGIDLSGIVRGQGDLNGDGRVDQSFANVVRVAAPNVTLRGDSKIALQTNSTAQVIFSEVQWNDRGQVVRTIDPEGNVSVTDYYPENDPDGDGTLTWAPYAVIGSEPTGYVRSVTVDAEPGTRRSTTVPPAALRASLRYDRVGNVVSTTNPRGVTTLIEVNQLNEPVVVTRGADVSQAVFNGQLLRNEAPFRYRSRITRDHNGRTIKTEVENRDGNTVGVGAFVEATVEYDILNDARRVAVEVDATTTLVSRFEYDPNQLRTRVIKPEGNTSLVEYDERNLPILVTAGHNDQSVAATVRFDYDLNGNRVRTTDAFDSDGDGNREVTRVVYDGFDRPVRAVDALGNSSECEYDVASNVVRCQAFGHTPGSAPDPTNLDADGRNPLAVLLSEQLSHHDELSRVYRADQRLLDVTSTGFTPQRSPDLRDENGDTLVTGFVEFDRLSRPVFMTEDDLETTSTFYDGVSRVVEAVDALGNRLQRSYDSNSNVVETRSIEVADGVAIPSETFVTRMVYDQLDRLVRATDNAGQTAYFSYDSRDNLISRSDPEGPQIADPLQLFPGQINSGGNTKSYVYDGLNRLLREVCDLRVGGTGAGALDTSNSFNADGQVTVALTYDGNSRVATRSDDNGNTTTYQYDALDRRIRQTFADDKFHEYVYDQDSALRTHTDPNGTTTTNTYDALNRTLRNVVTSTASGVFGPSIREYSFDGLSRMTAAMDNNGGGSGALHHVERIYDSLSRLIEEKQDGRAISNVFTGDGKRVQCTYPGGRAIESTFDGIDRVKTIQDVGETGAAIVMFDYMGPGGREIRRAFKNQTQTTFLNPTTGQLDGYDAVQRVVRLRSLDGAGGVIDDFEYGWSRSSQRTFERRHHDGGLTDEYTYDSLYRLVQVDYDQSGSGTARDLTRSTYVFDGVGNRRSVTHSRTSQGAVGTAYTPDVTNEYTQIQVGASAPVSIDNSDNGNVRADEVNVYLFDDRNRLVEVRDRASSGQNLVARYQYDALDRRVLKEVFDRGQALAVPLERIGYFYDGWQCVEETDSGGSPTKTYVYGRGVDDIVSARVPDGGSGLIDLFYCHNSLGSVTAVTDSAGNVVERYAYEAYGKTTVLNSDRSVKSSQVPVQPYGFTGRRMDYEEGSGLYFYRLRYYDPEAGRFISRDPLGMWGDAAQRGNAQNYCGNNPVNRVDPLGLEPPGKLVNQEEFWSLAIKQAKADGLPTAMLEEAREGTKVRVNPDLHEDVSAHYDDQERAINIRPELYERAKKGELGPLDLGLIFHETWHAFDHQKMREDPVGRWLARIYVWGITIMFDRGPGDRLRLERKDGKTPVDQFSVASEAVGYQIQWTISFLVAARRESDADQRRDYLEKSKQRVSARFDRNFGHHEESQTLLGDFLWDVIRQALEYGSTPPTGGSTGSDYRDHCALRKRLDTKKSVLPAELVDPPAPGKK